MKIGALSLKLTNAWHARTGPFADEARAAWKQRTRREQTLLLCGGVLMAAVLLWLVALRPALGTINQARSQLPGLQISAAQVNATILEARALSRGRLGVLSPGETEEALKAALRDMGLANVSTLSRLSGASASETQWQLSLINAPAAQIMAWLANLTFLAQVQTRQLDLARSNIDGRDRPGVLSGMIVLVLSTRETS
ncbi:type II secretion system protein GspM [Allopusillimonas ginsengisoli]|uniref:type II secretion system protein GspM n=1 Tax=Allopusillimonas ginsengisoli TaxID=453575 RepID=UPI0010C1BD7E|nr:type II secretion system protein M [Allopusillimonas ginsengisoli]